MNCTMTTAFATVVMAAGMGMGTAAANDGDMRARVPFAFRAGSVKVDAGVYNIQSMSAPGASGITIRDGKSGLGVALVVLPNWGVKPDATSYRLVFRKVGDIYFLAAIQAPQMERVLPMSNEERRLLKSGEKPQIAFVPLSRLTNGD